MTPEPEIMTPTAGDKVKVNQQSEQFGRIAEYGIVTYCCPNDEYLVRIGGQIRANIICKLSELTLQGDNE